MNNKIIQELLIHFNFKYNKFLTNDTYKDRFDLNKSLKLHKLLKYIIRFYTTDNNVTLIKYPTPNCLYENIYKKQNDIYENNTIIELIMKIYPHLTSHNIDALYNLLDYIFKSLCNSWHSNKNYWDIFYNNIDIILYIYFKKYFPVQLQYEIEFNLRVPNIIEFANKNKCNNIPFFFNFLKKTSSPLTSPSTLSPLFSVLTSPISPESKSVKKFNDISTTDELIDFLNKNKSFLKNQELINKKRLEIDGYNNNLDFDYTKITRELIKISPNGSTMWNTNLKLECDKYASDYLRNFLKLNNIDILTASECILLLQQMKNRFGKSYNFTNFNNKNDNIILKKYNIDILNFCNIYEELINESIIKSNSLKAFLEMNSGGSDDNINQIEMYRNRSSTIHLNYL